MRTASSEEPVIVFSRMSVALVPAETRMPNSFSNSVLLRITLPLTPLSALTSEMAAFWWNCSVIPETMLIDVPALNSTP